MSFQSHSVSNQWASRPADERYTSLTELSAAMHHTMKHSRAMVVPSKALTAVVSEQGALMVKGPSGNSVAPTHWAFGQLAQRAQAPAEYLRSLHPTLAADCINYGLQVLRPVDDIGVLLYANGGTPELHAVTGPNYGRVWNANVVDAIGNVLQTDGVNGARFNIPGEFGKRVPVTKDNTTLYASDRDMFCALADETKTLGMNARRDGQPGGLARGVAFGNSDVGGGTLWFAMFLYDYMCRNRIIWGMTELTEKRIRHTSSAPERMIREMMPAIEAFANSSAGPQEAILAAAQKQTVKDVDAFLKSRQFTRAQVAGIKAAYKTDEQHELSDAATIWNAVVGITAYARGLQYQDERVKLEREAGKILQAVAA